MIRTPDDENEAPGWFYPPFKAGLTYEGATYGGHTDYAVDFNRRTPEGGWLPDAGDPVLAAARGRVVEVDAPTGYVLIQHRGGFRTEYRHMQPVEVKVGQRVLRGARIGRIGDAGNAPNGTHLHHVHWQKKGDAWLRIPMTFEGVRVGPSVSSDAKPKGWTPPPAVLVVGPPRRATWKSAYRAAARALKACQGATPTEVAP